MNYKIMSGSSNKRFAILTKIVNFMKERHLNGDDHPITIEVVRLINSVSITIVTKIAYN